MIINHNIAALNTHRQLGANNVQASKNLEKLSSGLKINRAGDDAAGLAISEKMRGQIRGLDMATKNSQDGISLIQTAEGALNETHSILQRMRELAVQSGNDTNTDSDRGEIQKEINQLTSEVNRIGNTTEFNTKKLLNSAKTDVSVGVTTNGVAAAAEVKGIYTADLSKLISAMGDTDQIEVGGKTYTFKGTTPTAASGEFNDTASLKALIDADLTDFTSVVADGKITLTQNVGTDLATPPAGTQVQTAGKTVVAEVPGVHTFDLDTSKLSKGQSFMVGNQSFEYGKDFKDAAELATKIGATAAVSGNTITLTQAAGSGSAAAPKVSIVDIGQDGQKFSANLQIGANENQAMNIDINDMRASALGISGSGEGFTATKDVTNGTNAAKTEAGVDVSTHANAAKAVTTIQAAIDKVSAERSKLGANQNRLEHTINNLGTSSENLTAAESRIRDVDMAKEMMDFTKNNILTQAAQAMLAQANQQPQGVLQLLR